MKGVKGFQKGHPSYVGKMEKNHNWKGDDACRVTGNKRAQRMYPNVEPCEVCGGKTQIIRHHKNGDTLDNNLSNIRWMCRSHHKSIEHPEIGMSYRFKKAQ